MLIDEYQSQALKTAEYPSDKEMEYLLLGLSGEAGELNNKYKKVLRGDKEIDKEFRTEMAKELGDVLWYVALFAKAIGYNLDTVAQMNLSKLAARKEAGTIKGSGDNR